ncbi:MAG: hypothetical protein JOY99_12375 [Sphingomonadaceae bacterium]|nr:hypothetical protein [Sphingomonadaceae bacterium]
MKPGSRWKSAVCGAEFVVVRPPKQAGELKCGGHALLSAGTAAPEGLTIAEELADGIHMGKRYFDEASGLELLASKPGLGSLTLDGRKLAPKEAKALPSSD